VDPEARWGGDSMSAARSKTSGLCRGIKRDPKESVYHRTEWGSATVGERGAAEVVRRETKRKKGKRERGRNRN